MKLDAMREPAQLTLPTDADGVSAEFLTAALSAWYPGTVVESVRTTAPTHGTATKMALELTYAQPCELPRRLYVKAGWEQHSARVTANYRAEATFYSWFGESLPIEKPQCWFAGIDPNTGSALLLLEDLGQRNVTFGAPTVAASVDTVAQMLEVQATYHAAHWDSQILGAPWLKGSHAESGYIHEMLSEQHWSTHLALPRGEVLATELQDRVRMADALEHIYAITATPSQPCLIHADPHLGNWYYTTEGAPGLLDWQSPQRGHWAHDVTYTMVGALSVDDRREEAASLLRHYLGRLAASGVAAPGFDEAWLVFRQHAIYGVMWAMCPTEMQREENCYAMTERYSAAAVDLESLSVV